MVIAFYHAAGDLEGERRAAQRALKRIEKLLASEPDHGSALSFGVSALFTLGEIERGGEWIERALLLDPDNLNLHFNLACGMARLGETDAAIELLGKMLASAREGNLVWMETDTDLDPLRDDPRFKELFAAAKARLAKVA
jgi:adenylate cyclase